MLRCRCRFGITRTRAKTFAAVNEQPAFCLSVHSSLIQGIQGITPEQVGLTGFGKKTFGLLMGTK